MISADNLHESMLVTYRVGIEKHFVKICARLHVEERTSLRRNIAKQTIYRVQKLNGCFKPSGVVFSLSSLDMQQVQLFTFKNKPPKDNYSMEDFVFKLPFQGYTVAQIAALNWKIPQNAKQLAKLNESAVIQDETSVVPLGTKIFLLHEILDDEGFKTAYDASYYKIERNPKTHAETLGIMTSDNVWHFMTFEGLKGFEHAFGGIQWRIDSTWLAEARRAINRGKNVSEPIGSRATEVSVSGKGDCCCQIVDGLVRGQPLRSAAPGSQLSKPLCKALVDPEGYCVPLAFATATCLLLGETLPPDVFDQLTDKQGPIYKKYAATRPGEVPSTWARMSMAHFQLFLESKSGKGLLRWTNADAHYDQICDACLVKRPHRKSKSWTASYLCHYLVGAQTLLLLEICQGHCVCVDTRVGQNKNQPPVIYETDARYTHTIPLSPDALTQLGWKDCTSKVFGELRELRVKFKSNTQIPPEQPSSKKRKR